MKFVWFPAVWSKQLPFEHELHQSTTAAAGLINRFIAVADGDACARLCLCVHDSPMCFQAVVVCDHSGKHRALTEKEMQKETY